MTGPGGSKSHRHPVGTWLWLPMHRNREVHLCGDRRPQKPCPRHRLFNRSQFTHDLEALPTGLVHLAAEDRSGSVHLG